MGTLGGGTWHSANLLLNKALSVCVVHLIIGSTDKGVLRVIFGDDIRMDLCCHHVCVVVDPVEYNLVVVDKEESHVYL